VGTGAAIWVSIPLAVAGLAAYTRWIRERGSRLGATPFGVADTASAGVLALWFLSLLASSGGAEVAVTPSVIAASAVVYGGIVGLIVTSLIVRRISLRAAFGFGWKPGDGRMVVGGLLAVLPVVFAAQGLTSIFSEGGRQPLLDYWMANPGPGARALVVVMAVVVAPVCEEFLFRGYLFNVGRKYAGTWWAMLVASLLFAAIHGHLPSVPGLLLLAVGFNLVYVWTGSLLAPIVMHAIFNGLSLLAALLWPGIA